MKLIQVMTQCPACGKVALRREVRSTELYGFHLGEYSADVCPSCGEIFWKAADVKQMEERAKKLGIWGLEHKTTIGVAGNSLIVRVPKSIAKFIGLKKGEVVSLHPQGRTKLLIEETNKTRERE